MIHSLSMSNFQSHKNTELELHPGVNVIIGPSDSGKSSIMRALYWALFNRPVGDAFKSNWKHEECAVSVNFEDGTVTRVKNKSFNGYLLEAEDIKHPEFSGFGRSMPGAVSSFINMTAINFQRQMDPPFMLNWSPGDRGAFLNDITNLDIIDKSITSIKKIIKKETTGISTCEDNIDDIKEQLKEFKYLKDFEEELESLEKNQYRLETLQSKEKDLTQTLVSLVKQNGKVKKYKRVLKAEKEVKRLDNLCKEIKRMEVRMDELEQLLTDITNVNEEIKEYKTHIRELKKQFDKLMPNKCPLCGK